MKFWRVLWHLPRVLMGVQVGSGVRKDRTADAYTTQWVQNAFEN